MYIYNYIYIYIPRKKKPYPAYIYTHIYLYIYIYIYCSLLKTYLFNMVWLIRVSHIVEPIICLCRGWTARPINGQFYCGFHPIDGSVKE